MAKKLRNLLLLGTAIGAAAAGTYYFLQKRDEHFFDEEEDDDFDDFDAFEDPEEIKSADSTRNYVPLHFEAGKATEAEPVKESTPTVSKSVEEYFDEDETDEVLDDIVVDED